MAKIYPDLVAHHNDGKPYTVRYQYLATMLLNEVQKQSRHAQRQDETIQVLREQNRKLEARLAALEALLSGKGSMTATAGQ